MAHRLLEKCNAVLRLEGASKGADNDVKIAKERGLKIYYSLDQIPDLSIEYTPTTQWILI